MIESRDATCLFPLFHLLNGMILFSQYSYVCNSPWLLEKTGTPELTRELAK